MTKTRNRGQRIMVIRDENTGFEVTVTFDAEGFPLVSIETGGGFYAENFRPTVEVKLNGMMIHEMFDEDDERWAEGDDEAEGIPAQGNCNRCGSPLTGTCDAANPANNRGPGYCSDQTCPHNDHLQHETWREG
jgi:hypothetical protein